MSQLDLTTALLADDRQASAMEARIEKYLRRRSGVSLVEMARDIPGFTGESTWGRADLNIVLWAKMSAAAIAAMKHLLEEERIVPTPTNWLVYNFDGGVLDMPIANDVRRKYAKPHWFPIVLAGGGEAE